MISVRNANLSFNQQLKEMKNVPPVAWVTVFVNVRIDSTILILNFKNPTVFL